MFAKGKNNQTVWVPKDKFEAYSGGAQPSAESTPEKIVSAHGPANDVQITFDHSEGGKHRLVSKHEDGHRNESCHSSAAEALETGGRLANTDVKRRTHYDQGGAESEERGVQQPDLA
jgi:hypothetical protein